MSSARPSPHTKSYVCNHVFEGERPVLYVSRADGDWCFLCGADDHEQLGSAFQVVGLSHELAKDSTLESVLDLAPEEEADRAAVGAPWVRSTI